VNRDAVDSVLTAGVEMSALFSGSCPRHEPPQYRQREIQPREHVHKPEMHRHLPGGEFRRQVAQRPGMVVVNAPRRIHGRPREKRRQHPPCAAPPELPDGKFLCRVEQERPAQHRKKRHRRLGERVQNVRRPPDRVAVVFPVVAEEHVQHHHRHARIHAQRIRKIEARWFFRDAH